MGDLDGVWRVERAGGALPPLAGVRKRIHGARGETRIGALPGVPFDVDGLELRYRQPFRFCVDVLEPDGSGDGFGYRGRATVLGLTIGEFTMRRIDVRERSKANR